MFKLDVVELRPKIDMEGRYADFGQIRSLLSVSTVAEDSGVHFSDPSFEGEMRGRCPACGKDKSLAVNINTNRFNCFGKGCILKGGGVIDFFSKLNSITSKEACHLLSCAYGLPPYSSESEPVKPKDINPTIRDNGVESTPAPNGPVTRSEFNDLKARFDRLSTFFWSYMLEHDDPGGIAEEYDPPLTKHHVTQ